MAGALIWMPRAPGTRTLTRSASPLPERVPRPPPPLLLRPGAKPPLYYFPVLHSTTRYLTTAPHHREQVDTAALPLASGWAAAVAVVTLFQLMCAAVRRCTPLRIPCTPLFLYPLHVSPLRCTPVPHTGTWDLSCVPLLRHSALGAQRCRGLCLWHSVRRGLEASRSSDAGLFGTPSDFANLHSIQPEKGGGMEGMGERAHGRQRQ